MEPRRIYLSYSSEDAERMRPLRTVLEAAGMTILTGSVDAIRSATAFLACFSAGTDGSTRYNAEELRQAIEHARGGPPEWLMLVQATPCAIPALPGLPGQSAVLDLQGRWFESIAYVLSTPAATRGSSTFIFTTDQQQVGGNMRLTNLDSRNGEQRGDAEVRSEINAKSVVVDGDFDFTNFVNRGD